MDFKNWLEAWWQEDRGKKIPPQEGPIYTFYTHPEKPDILWEPAREKVMSGGEWSQWVRTYKYDKKYHKLTKAGDELFYLDDIDKSLIKPVELNNPVIAY